MVAVRTGSRHRGFSHLRRGAKRWDARPITAHAGRLLSWGRTARIVGDLLPTQIDPLGLQQPEPSIRSNGRVCT